MDRDTSGGQSQHKTSDLTITTSRREGGQNSEYSSVLKDTALSSEKRRYSVQNAAGPAGPVVERATSTQRISPRATPYLSVPTSTDVSPPGHLPRASIACIPLSIQAQLQQNQSVKSERPSLVLQFRLRNNISLLLQPLCKRHRKRHSCISANTKLSISKNPEAESDQTKKLGRLPKSFRCECCQQVTVTRTTYQIGALTWLMAAFIFLCGMNFVFSTNDDLDCLTHFTVG
ncbi:unnamed protein product [Heterobilharzia americana]|nr:unnamed protein product [Heterobilharzia americana]